MSKIPEYTRKAINKYNDKFDRIAVNLPKGTKDRIKELTGLSCNKFISELTIKELDRIEKERAEPEKPDIPALYEKYKSGISEFVVQLEIQEKYGNEVLLQLSEYAKEHE